MRYSRARSIIQTTVLSIMNEPNSRCKKKINWSTCWRTASIKWQFSHLNFFSVDGYVLDLEMVTPTTLGNLASRAQKITVVSRQTDERRVRRAYENCNFTWELPAEYGYFIDTLPLEIHPRATVHYVHRRNDQLNKKDASSDQPRGRRGDGIFVFSTRLCAHNVRDTLRIFCICHLCGWRRWRSNFTVWRDTKIIDDDDTSMSYLHAQMHRQMRMQ